MSIADLKESTGHGHLGQEMMDLAAELYPLCRSITGDGVRQTLNRIGRNIPLQQRSVPSGTPAFDWTVPKEWNIRDAFIKNAAGDRLLDFRQCNLHVVGYSIPVHERMTFTDLRPHLHSIPDYPDWVPYRTSYYAETWGFCLSHGSLEQLERESKPDDLYEVCIDSTLEDGELTYGEVLLPGACCDEVLLSCHICHPSLANDNLSGIAVAVALARDLSQITLRHTFRFLFIPGTIGAIAWLSRNEATASRIKHGLVMANLGDSGNMHYKRSRVGDAEIDRTVEHVLGCTHEDHEILSFSPYGYDERQFCSPGFNLPVGSLTRTPFGQYPQYHTSADNLQFITPSALEDSYLTYLAVIEVLEGNGRFLNQNPKCEPQLGKRGLYDAIGGRSGGRTDVMAMLWTLNQSDGRHSLLDIAIQSGMEFSKVRAAADLLIEHDLLEPCEWEPPHKDS